jgi:6-phosphogluconolactonase
MKRLFSIVPFALLIAGVGALGAAALARPAAGPAARRASMGKMRLYVGTYTAGGSKGIYTLDLDLSTGALTPPTLAAESPDPSFLAIHPDRRFLYAVNELSTFQGASSGAVSAFAIEPGTGKLKFLNQQPSRGAGPCYIVTDRGGKNVLVANYGGGSVAVLPIRPDGRLGEATAFVQHQGSSANPQRQEAPHGHSINLDRANRFALAADLGLDKILVYRFDPAAGTLTPNTPPAAALDAGAGPRHLAFHPDGRYAYVINEIASSVTAFAYDPDHGTLRALQTISTVPEGAPASNSTAEVVVHPSGKFLYGSNRGHDSIAVFAIDPATGRLSLVGHQATGGKTPRNFAIDPTGTYLLAENQQSNSIVVFRIDPQTGALQATGQTASVPSPVCIRMIPLEPAR